MDTITTIPDLLTLSGSAQPVMVSLTAEDSRLIAAAPELLKACKLARDFMNDVGATKEHLAYTAEFEAIAKAEGR